MYLAQRQAMPATVIMLQICTEAQLSRGPERGSPVQAGEKRGPPGLQARARHAQGS